MPSKLSQLSILNLKFFSNFLYKIIILIIYIFFIFSKKNLLKFKLKQKNVDYKLKENFKYSLSECLKNITNSTNLYFKYIILNYHFSVKFKLIEVQYNIFFYDENLTLINPSNLILYNELHIICHMQKFEYENSINTFANIIKNKYFNCIEYLKINEEAKFGIKIFNNENEIIKIDTIYLFNNQYINFHYFKLKRDNIFDYLIINKEYIKNIKKLENNEKKNFYLSFFEAPNCFTKSEIALKNNEWYYRNIYNNYFCFCKGSLCLFRKINQKCKYRFYLYIIFNNRYLYNKTDYLLADCLELKLSEDYIYNIYLEMIKQNLSAHYITLNENIYNNFSNNNIIDRMNSNKIIYKWKLINGDFLEKYLELILKLKVVLAAFGYLSIDNIFYNIEYITYIYLGHGIHYFKRFLYNNYHSCEKYNKILIPPSDKLISIAKKYGFKDENIIKLGLPKWDKLNQYSRNTKNNTIFLMFTWRQMKQGKNISDYYLNNTFNLLSNKKLNKILKNKNITFFYTFHHKLKNLKKNNFEKKLNKLGNLYKIEQNQIFECISKSSLFISDFSSVVFDFIYQKKPFILFLPDSEDPNIKDIYNENYYDIIKSLKNGTIFFKNKFFDLDKAINKIIYYINNNFNIELTMENFYNSFHLNGTNNTKIFIEYLKNLQ